LIDNVVWVSQWSNFVHKSKEFGAAYKKLWGEMCTGFGGQN